MLNARESGVRGPRFAPQRLHLFLIVLAVVVFYGRTVDNYWFKDDLNLHLLSGDDGAVDWSKLKAFLWPSHMTSEQYWRPIPIILGFCDYAIWGTHPAGFHIVNTIFHALNGILLYFVVNRLTDFRRPIAGFVAALLFVIDPIHGESVVWILQRMVLMCATFSLATILAWLKAVESGSRFWRGIALLLLACGMLSKEIAATLPAALFFIEFLWMPEPRGFVDRVKRAVIGILPCAVLVAIYVLLRWIIFGRIDIKYAGLEPREYAAHNHVFEKLPMSLFYGLFPINHAVIDRPWRGILQTTMVVGFSAAALRALWLLFASATYRRIALFFSIFFAASFIPTTWIFWIDENLFNGRFFYQLGLAVVVLAATALWLPSRDDRSIGGKASTIFAFVTSATLLFSFAFGLMRGLDAFEGASAQVRGIQQSIAQYTDAEERRTGRRPAIVALGVPNQWKGVPTFEWNIELALAMPLHSPKVDVVPLLDIDEENWFRVLSERRALLGRRFEDLRYVRCEYDPPGITPVFGAREAPVGPFAAEPTSPEDFTGLSNAGAEPEFRWRPTGSPERFRLVFETDEKALGSIAINVVVGKNAEKIGDEVVYRLSRKDAVVDAFPDIWETVVRKHLPRPSAVAWRVESWIGKDGVDARLIGASANRRLIVFNEIR